MSHPAFILFKEGRRFQAAFLALSGDVEIVTFHGCDYLFCGQVPFYHHILDGQSRLVGFALDEVRNHVKKSGLLSWIKDSKNAVYDSDTVFFYLHWPQPISLEHDGASLVGANFYHNGGGDFLIQIDDVKSQFASQNKFQNLWSEIAFPLASSDQFAVKNYPQ